MSDIVQVTPAPRISPLTQGEVVGWIRTRTAAQLRSFIAALEACFGIAAPPEPVWQGTSNPPWIFEGESNPPPPSVVLLDAGPARIQSIKAVRQRRGLALQDAKALIERAPVVVLESIDKEDARSFCAALEALGAQVTLD